MSDTIESLRRKIHSAKELKSVVHTMKVLAATSIGQYEKSVHALGDYYHTVELGLSVCFRRRGVPRFPTSRHERLGKRRVGVVIFGSDQGLVGRYNEVVVQYAISQLVVPPPGLRLWAIGERVHAGLTDAGYQVAGLFSVPSSVQAITPLVGKILVEVSSSEGSGGIEELYLFYNRPASGTSYAPVTLRLLPLDERFCRDREALPWPTKAQPEVMGRSDVTLRALIGEYLFVSLFRAAAEAQASENASRLAAMQRAEKNIEELLDELNGAYHRLRQSGIDAELFDVISGFEALGGAQSARSGSAVVASEPSGDPLVDATNGSTKNR